MQDVLLGSSGVGKRSSRNTARVQVEKAERPLGEGRLVVRRGSSQNGIMRPVGWATPLIRRVVAAAFVG